MLITKREEVTKQGFCKILWRKLRSQGSLVLELFYSFKWLEWGWALIWVWLGWGGGGRLFEAGSLLYFYDFGMGAYSRWALIRGWALIRIITLSLVICVSWVRETHFTVDMCFPCRGTPTTRDLFFLDRRTLIARDLCFLCRGTYTTRDICFLCRGTHIPSDMCFLGRGTHIIGNMCSPTHDHISLVIMCFLGWGNTYY